MRRGALYSASRSATSPNSGISAMTHPPPAVRHGRDMPRRIS